LRLIDAARENPERAREIVRSGLDAARRLAGLKSRSLYAVGGVWRSFASVDMAEFGYPLHVLHNYAIPGERAVKISRVLARLSRRSFDLMRVVSRRRAEALPYGAIVLEELLEATGLDQVVISAYGLREGLLYEQLSAEERAKDPLITYAAATNARISRTPDHAREMFDWLAPLFPDESGEAKRIRLAACLFSDIAWRRHPDDRAIGAFNQVLAGPFAGADHHARALIAAAVFHRYWGEGDFPQDHNLGALLGPDEASRAVRLGLSMRFALALSTGAPGELAHYRLRMTSTRIVLEIPRRRAQIAGEPVQKRLMALASNLGRKGEIVTG
jgi:exopolyphosphatase / guanosine-5'-triphosphate,3'-diphosphate pyrophosphatase